MIVTAPKHQDALGPVSRRRLRVMQVNYRHTFGGSERLAATIGTSLDPTRFESCFAAMKGDGEVGEVLRAQGYKTVVFGRNEGFDPLVYWRVWNYLRNNPVDIIQTHHVGSLVYCAPPARALGIKIVHTEHDIHSFIRLPNELRWIKRLSSLPAKYIVIDPTIRDYLASEVQIPEEKIVVIRNGVNLQEFRVPPARPTGLDQPFVLGWVSRLAPPKRPDILVDAMALLAKEDPLLRARIIGGGEQLDGLGKQVAELGLQDRIELLGPRNDIGDQLQTMDAYVLCTEREGLPISLVEAMATERPTIVSAVGGIPALIEDKRNGYLLHELSATELAGVIRHIRRHPEEAARLGAAGASDARKRFDLKETIQQYMDVFEEVARPTPAPAMTNPSFKQASFRVLCGTHIDSVFRKRQEGKLVIIGYHGIVPDSWVGPPSWLMLRASDFKSQLTHLKDHYDVIPMAEAARRILHREPFHRPTAAITIDDGYKNNLTVAAPILKQLQLPATIYLATGMIGTDAIHWTARLEQAMFCSTRTVLDVADLGLRRYPLGINTPSSFVRLVARLYRWPDEPRNRALAIIQTRLAVTTPSDFSQFLMMTWEDVRNLCQGGLIDFGGHTVHHQIVEPLNDAELEAEIGGSIEEIRRHTRCSSTTFAYPNGTPADFDERAEQVLKRHHILAAVSTIDGINDADSPPFALRRITVGAQMSIDEFRLRTSGVIDLAKRFIGTQ